MAKQTMVECQQCHHPMIMTNKKRRLCHVCQAERDLRKLTKRGTRARGKTCSSCGGRFFPIRSNFDQCPTCVEFPRPDRFPACKHCGKCYRPAPGLDGTDRGCWVCITSSSANQRKYYNTVRTIVANRISSTETFTFDVPWPPPDDWEGSAHDWAQKHLGPAAQDDDEIVF